MSLENVDVVAWRYLAATDKNTAEYKAEMSTTYLQIQLIIHTIANEWLTDTPGALVEFSTPLTNENLTITSSYPTFT